MLPQLHMLAFIWAFGFVVLGASVLAHNSAALSEEDQIPSWICWLLVAWPILIGIVVGNWIADEIIARRPKE